MLKGKKELYGFGPFRLDVSEHRLERDDGIEVPYLPEKAFQTLVVLVRNSGALVEKEQLLNEVWPDTIVEENNLDKCVYTIRQALGDRPSQHHYVETVRKHGYRFVAPVRRLGDEDALAASSKDPGGSHSDIEADLDPKPADDNGSAPSRLFRSAYEAYQLARVKYYQTTEPTTIEARELIGAALRLDPDFAPAYSLSAEIGTLEVIVGLKSPANGFPQARADIERAYELGADTADFYAAAGYVDLLADWNFAAAEKNLRRSLAINPHFGTANRMLGEALMFQGRHGEAAVYIGRAQVDDITSLVNANILAISRFLARDYPAVIEVCDRILALAPRYIIAAWEKSWALEQMGRLIEAIAGYEKILRLPHGVPALRWVGYAYAVSGDRQRALEVIERLESAEIEHGISPTHKAAIYAGLGDQDEALGYLQQGLDMRDPFMLWIGTDPRFDNLRGDERFEAIVRRIFPNGIPARSDQQVPGEVKEAKRSASPLPSLQITESGQHALVDIYDWHTVIERLGAQNELSKNEDRKQERTPEDHRVLPTGNEHEPSNVTVPSEPGARTFSNTHRRWIALAGLMIALAIAVITALTIFQAKSPETAALAQKRLTTGGGVTRVAMSKDGRYSAVVQNAAVKLFDLQTRGERILVPAEPGIRILTLAFHPDGNSIYFGKRKVEITPVTLYRMPLSGGEATKILDDIYGPMTFSPDQKKIAFVRRYTELNEFNILTADADGSNIVKLASSQMPNRFEGGPAWSPDGKTILCPRISVEGGFHYTIAAADVSTGLVREISGPRWTWMLYLFWLPDSKRILMTAQNEGEVNAQLWRLDTETGAASKVTNDSFVYESLAGSADGRAFVATKVRQNSHVWLMADALVQLTTGFDKYDGVDGLAWAPNGTIFYHSRASEREAIWQMQENGTGAKEITTDSGGGFAVSPDGRYLVFERQEPNSFGLQLMDLADSSISPLTQNVMASNPAYSPDGSSIVFSRYDKKLSLFEIPAGGGEATMVSIEYQAARAPAISPSGRFVAFAFSRAQTDELQSGIAVTERASKKVISIFPIKSGLGGTYEKPTIQWSADETELYFIEIDLPSSTSNIVKLRLADGAISKVTQFNSGRVFNFAVEPGGNRIVIAYGTVDRDATLIKLDNPM